MLQNSFGKPLASGNKLEDGRRNIFLESTAGKKSEASSAAFSPNLGLDLRLEIDRVRSDNRELTDLNETLADKIGKMQTENFLWKLEAARLGAVTDELAQKVKLLHNHLEEATRVAGDPSERERDLEAQLESLLGVNQKNLESLKYCKMSLEKSRKKNDSLLAENALLKMTLKAFAVQAEKRPSRNTDHDIRNEYTKLLTIHSSLQDKFALLQKQNEEQASFAKALDGQVTQMASVIKAAKESDAKVKSLSEENEHLKRAIDELTAHKDNADQSVQVELDKPGPRSTLSTEKLETERNRDRSSKATLIIKAILEEFSNIFNLANKDNPLFYECEILRVKIQALTRSVELFFDSELTPFSETLQNVLVLPPPKAPNLNTIMSNAAAMCRSLEKLFGGYLNQTGSRWASRTRSESKNPPRNSEEDSMVNTDQYSAGIEVHESTHKQELLAQLTSNLRQLEEANKLNLELSDRLNSLEEDHKLVGDRLKEAESELREKMKELKERDKENKRLQEEERKNVDRLREMERKFEQFRAQIVGELQTSKDEIKVILKERDDYKRELLKERQYVEEVKQRIEQIDEDVKGREHRIKLLTAKLEDKEQECINYQREVNNLTSRVSALQSEISTTTRSLLQERQMIAELQSSYKELSNQYESLRHQSQGQSQMQSNQNFINIRSNSADADCDIEDMKDFVRSMKRDADYQSSESSKLEKLKAKNEMLMMKLLKAEQAQASLEDLEMLKAHNEALSQQNKQLEDQNRLCREELKEIEKTAKLMKEKLQHHETLRKNAEELQKSCSEKDRQINSLTTIAKNLNDKVESLQDKDFNISQAIIKALKNTVQEIKRVKESLSQARSQSQELQKVFSSRIGSLVGLFRTEAEIAPKGTLDRLSKIKDSEDRARGAQKFREEGMKDLEKENKLLREELREYEKRMHSLTEDLMAERKKQEEFESELKESYHRENIVQNEAKELMQEKKNLQTINENMAKALDRLSQQKHTEEDSLKSLKQRLQAQETKLTQSIQTVEYLQSEIEDYKQSREEATEIISQLTFKLTDAEERNAELEAANEAYERELAKKKAQLKDAISNKENIRNNDNQTNLRSKELEAQVEILGKKLEQRSLEVDRLRQK